MDPQALGRFLRQTREAKELTLDEAERALRIRRRILEGFEVGEFVLPEFAPIQIRGFVRNYARFLGLDEDRVLVFYEEALEEGSGSLTGRRRAKKRSGGARRGNGKRDTGSSQLLAARSITDTQPTLPTTTSAGLSTGLRDRPRGGGLLAALTRVLVALAALAVIVFVTAELLRTSETEQPQVNDGNGVNVIGVPPSLPTFTPLPTQIASTPTLALPLQPGFTGQGVLVTIEMTQRSYLRISADGVEQFAGLMRAGDVLEIPANNSITIKAGNAEALRIVYNGQRQPVFGDRGQAVDLTFTATGVDVQTGPGFEPTPEVPPTALPSPTPDTGALVVMLTPTNTPGPSPTPSDTPTITNTPSITPTPTETPTMSMTPSETSTPTNTPTATPIPTDTPVPTDTPIPTNTLTPSPTAILPPREPAPGATPTKSM